MTHDKLLAKIEEEASYQTLVTVLRAVVELHKPIEGYEHLCGACWFGDGMMAYPCPTILQIEKELK